MKQCFPSSSGFVLASCIGGRIAMKVLLWIPPASLAVNHATEYLPLTHLWFSELLQIYFLKILRHRLLSVSENISFKEMAHFFDWKQLTDLQTIPDLNNIYFNHFANIFAHSKIPKQFDNFYDKYVYQFLLLYLFYR